MERIAAVSFIVLLFASLAAADGTRGGFVVEGYEFPHVADLDGNGLDDLIQMQFVLLNQGSGTFVKRDLGLMKDEYVVDSLDLNGAPRRSPNPACSTRIRSCRPRPGQRRRREGAARVRSPVRPSRR